MTVPDVIPDDKPEAPLGVSSPSDSDTVSVDAPTSLPDTPPSNLNPEKSREADADLERQEIESAQPPALSPHDEVPEGGLDAWLQVFGSWVVLGVTWGLVNSFGVFQTYYEEELLSSSSASEISWIGSLQGSLLLCLGMISGPLYDAGYFRQLLWAGLFLIIFGQFMVSLATEYWQMILAQGVCIGVGCGLTFLPATAIISQYFRRRRALVIGISATGSPVGGLIFPILFGKLQPVIGFAWTARIIAFILLGVSIVPLIWMHTRVPVSGQKRSLIDSTALREPSFVFYTIGCFFAFMGLYVVFFYIEVFAVSFNIGSDDFRPYFVSLLSAASVVGRLGPTYMADRLGALNIMSTVTVICSVLCFGWIGIREQGGLIAFALLYGCFSGAVVSVMPSAVVNLTPDIRRVGTRMGMVCLMAGLSLLVGTPIAGVILGDKSEVRWISVAAYSGALLVLGGVTMGASRWLHWRATGVVRG